jgi:hypothetical protein
MVFMLGSTKHGHLQIQQQLRLQVLRLKHLQPLKHQQLQLLKHLRLLKYLQKGQQLQLQILLKTID